MRSFISGTVALASFLAISSNAATLFDSFGFEAPTYSLGNLSGQNGWDFFGPGAATVQNTVVNGGSQAVQLSGAASTWHWPNLGYTPGAGEIVRVSFDVRASAPAPINNFGYFVDVYNTGPEGGNRVARTGLFRTATGSMLALITIGQTGPNAPGSYTIGNPLAADTWFNFVMDLNFATDTFAVSVNGSTIASGLSFVTASTGIGDADLQLSGTAGATDSGFFDNYRVEAIVIPEPGVLSIALVGGLAFVALRRRKA